VQGDGKAQSVIPSVFNMNYSGTKIPVGAFLGAGVGNYSPPTFVTWKQFDAWSKSFVFLSLYPFCGHIFFLSFILLLQEIKTKHGAKPMQAGLGNYITTFKITISRN
jgi:TRAP-type C4-dicarboxylate transport system permease small subunit